MRSEANIFRYRTTLEPVVIYIGEHHALRDVYRQLLAAAVTGTEVRVVAPAAVAAGLEAAGITVDAHTVEGTPPRVRVIGDAPGELYGDVSTAVFDGPALIDGRRELLPYLLEQSVSATLHRFGVIHDPAGIRG